MHAGTKHHQPTKYEVREWLAELVEDRRPLPDQDAIKNQLWPIDERDRRQAAS